MLAFFRYIIFGCALLVAVFLPALPAYAADGPVDIQLYAPSDGAKTGVISRNGLVILPSASSIVRCRAGIKVKGSGIALE